MDDKDFYGKGSHSMGGSEMVKINGQWYEKTFIDYLKSQNPLRNERKTPKKSQSSKPVGETTTKEEEDTDNKREQRERLVLLQTNRSRLQKQIDDLDRVIKVVKLRLEDN